MPMEKFNLKDFTYFKEIDLPKLILGIEISHDFPRKYNGKPSFKFQKIAHQTAGHGCNQHYIYGIVLDPKPSIKKVLTDICAEWLDSDAGVFGVPLDEISKYRKQIQSTLGVDCNFVYDIFEEGIYPIDYSRENLEKLASNAKKIPKDLDTMVKWDSKLGKLCGFIGRWKIFILGPNCD